MFERLIFWGAVGIGAYLALPLVRPLIYLGIKGAVAAYREAENVIGTTGEIAADLYAEAQQQLGQ